MAKPSPKFKLRVAWTVDDGPTSITPKMLAVFDNTLNKPIPVTWFIQYDYLKNGHGVIGNGTIKEGYYENLQKKGHEIGIHGVSTIVNHVHWFPTDNSAHSYITTQQAVQSIKAFQLHLNKNSIKVKFVRAPTGLQSELMANLKKLQLGANLKPKPANMLRDKTARGIIKGQYKPGDKNNAISTVATNFATLKAGLNSLSLHLWGGSATGAISAQSWEVESSGDPTKHRGDSLKLAYMQLHYHNVKKDRSLIILCHDTSQPDVKEVERDILMMEDFAQKNNLEIEYHTMSSLYKILTGNAP